MFTVQLSGFEPNPLFLSEIYKSADGVYNALPLNSEFNVSLKRGHNKKIFHCVINFHSSWGHSEVREAWSLPSEALRAALISISEDIKSLRGNVKDVDENYSITNAG